MQENIGPNAGRPIVNGWSNTAETFQSIFKTMANLASAFKNQGVKVSPTNLAIFGENMKPPAGIVNANKKIQSLFGGKGK